MQDLTEKTWKIIERLFPNDKDAVGLLLVTDCGTNLPFCEKSTSADLERVRFAVLKLSAGDMGKLLEAITIAKTDWRDVLAGAGFADSLAQHHKWASILLSS
jgi:hypothetical protein